MSFGFTILGSGSAGNAAVIHAPEGDLLLDAGFSAKELCRRLKIRGIDPAGIRAVLLTHEHDDHVSGCRVFAEQLDIPVYLSASVSRYFDLKKEKIGKRHLISPGFAFELLGMRIEPFMVPHDVETLGYVFHFDTHRLAFATDFGSVNMLVLQKLRGCQALVIESNYEPELLRNSARPLHLKRRILGKQGHLSNEVALELMEEVLTGETRILVFAHLSRECNDAELLEQKTKERLAKLKRNDILFRIACQGESLETIMIFNQ